MNSNASPTAGAVLVSVTDRVPGRLLRLCLVGSTAYGLDHPDSDRDYLGVYAAPNDEVLGLGSAAATSNTVTSHDPDWAVHEILKLFKLALGGNPTILELLSAPRVLDHVGGDDGPLNAGLSACLSTGRVRDAYIGYATGQARKIESGRMFAAVGKDARTRKQARHCLRLLYQAEHLLATGRVTVDVSPLRDQIFDTAELAVSDVDEFLRRFERLRARTDRVKSVLPDAPDVAAVQDALLAIRDR